MINTLIEKLSFEAHLPGGYKFCGPGTKLTRLTRNDVPINALDAACKKHDLAYARNKDLTNRHLADLELAEAAARRQHAADANLKEKLAAALVKNIMKIKRKLGWGLNFRSNALTPKTSLSSFKHKTPAKHLHFTLKRQRQRSRSAIASAFKEEL
ncbi:unnamed protein product [Brassicogethes aeneus]|uniref:Phospholipase A2-like domain-containing protein n=1 Tax=Brassicogethes aeneus TaxID=1431903 RepID=A0A9P0FDA2_BRAAE|nr:unnamed protein product [Brassicogethes aeneus]